MPRRRTKKQVPPLAFVESPIHIVNNPPDPVFASDHPLTADVIPVDEEVSVVWVSPQFHGLPTPGPSRRQCRGKHSLLSTTTRSRHLSGRVNNTIGGRVTRNQSHHRLFPALEFIEEPAIQQPPSPCEEFSLDEQHGVNIKINEVQTNLDTVHNCNTPVAGFCGTPKHVENRELQTNLSVLSNEDSPSPRPRRMKKGSTARSKKGTVKKKKGRLKDLAAQLDFTPIDEDQLVSDINYNKCETAGENSSEACIIKKKNGIFERTKEVGVTPIQQSMESHCLTQLRPQSKEKPQRKRLFTLRTQEGFNGIKNTDGENYMDEFDKIKTRSSRSTNKNKEQLQTDENVFSPIPGYLRCSTPPQFGGLLQTEQQRGMFLPLMLATQQTPSDHKPHVLVYDTPEEDYGLTLCQRRLRLLKHHRRKKHSNFSSPHKP